MNEIENFEIEVDNFLQCKKIYSLCETYIVEGIAKDRIENCMSTFIIKLILLYCNKNYFQNFFFAVKTQ